MGYTRDRMQILVAEDVVRVNGVLSLWVTLQVCFVPCVSRSFCRAEDLTPPRRARRTQIATGYRVESWVVVGVGNAPRTYRESCA